MVDLPPAPSPGGVYTVCIFMPIAATIAVALRFWVRRVRKLGCGLDDWTILLALIILWAMSGLIMKGVSLRLFGYHTNLDPSTGEEIITWRERRQVKYTTVFMMMNVICLGIVKLSVLFLYRRLFAISRHFNTTSIIIGVLVFLWAFGFLLSYIFQCGTNLWAAWTSLSTIEQYCDNDSAQTVSFCITDIVTDIMILITPIPMIMKLQISIPQKLGICAVFALGLLSTAAGSVRAVITGLFELGTTVGCCDLIGANTNIVVWSLVEVGVAIIAASLPTIRPLFVGKSPDSIFRSFRSLFSLQSHNSSIKSAGYEEHSLRHEFHEDAYPLSPAKKSKDRGSISTGETRNSLEAHGNWRAEAV